MFPLCERIVFSLVYNDTSSDKDEIPIISGKEVHAYTDLRLEVEEGERALQQNLRVRSILEVAQHLKSSLSTDVLRNHTFQVICSLGHTYKILHMATSSGEQGEGFRK